MLVNEYRPPKVMALLHVVYGLCDENAGAAAEQCWWHFRDSRRPRTTVFRTVYQWLGDTRWFASTMERGVS